jgi:hypothetical protein
MHPVNTTAGVSSFFSTSVCWPIAYHFSMFYARGVPTQLSGRLGICLLRLSSVSELQFCYFGSGDLPAMPQYV